MRNLLAFLMALVLGFAGVGYYLGWYRIESKPASEGHHSYNVDVDGKKISDDLRKGEEKIHQTLDSKNEAPANADATKSNPKP